MTICPVCQQPTPTPALAFLHERYHASTEVDRGFEYFASLMDAYAAQALAERNAEDDDEITMKTNQQIVNDCLALAQRFYSMHGYQVPDGYRFDLASHPQERLMWVMAVEAYEHIEGTPVEDCMEDLDDE